ncbi:MAG: MarR family transcriptional regulator [Myxococcota bacterium]
MATRRELERRVLEAGRRNSRSAVLFHTHMAERIGLNATDTKALDLVMETGPLTPGEIAKATGLTSASVTTLLDRLESRGLVERSPDPDDRRRVRVSACPHAVEVVAEHIVPFLHELAASLAQFDEAELAAIARFMEVGAALAMKHAVSGQAEGS